MSMQATMSLPTKTSTATPLAVKRSEDTIGTRVWLDEYTFLQSIYHSADNCSPKFRLPDLISACVSLVFLGPGPAQRIFSYLHTEMILRDQNSVRRQEEMWKPQYQLLLDLQRSPSNCHPHPQFKLDHFTTTCIALVTTGQEVTHRILAQARRNTVERAARRIHAQPLNQ